MDQSRNLSDLLVEYLEQLGVEYVFGVPGAHIAALYEALARSEKRGGPRAILTRHETGAANMADGYARESGKLGVCCATTGPGATNLLTGVASSFIDHTPILVLTGQTPLPKFGRAAFQESSPDRMDTTAMLKECTYYSSVVTHAEQFESKLTHALLQALRAPRGPVHLSIPLDISRAPAPAQLSYPAFADLVRHDSLLIDQHGVETLIQLVNKTLDSEQRIVLLVGHDCAGATDDLMTFAERVNAQVITTQRGKTWADPYHPLVRGVFGYAGHQSARAALEDKQVGLILAAGTGLGQWSTAHWDDALLNDKLVHIHAISDYFSRSPMAQLQLHGKVNAVFKALNQQVKKAVIEERVEALMTPLPRSPAQITLRQPENYGNQQIPLHPQFLIRELLQKRFPSDTRFIVDTTNWIPWTLHYFFSPQHENYRLSSELAAMGWGIGAAVGTAFATPKTPVVCLVGDGGFLMNGQEITVAVEAGLAVIYLILNDRTYGMVQHRHRQVSDERIEFAVPPVDFSAMAQAMGANGHTIRTLDDLQQLDMDAICQRQGPTVLDLYIDPEVTPPMGMF